ncbi:hypothetical protein PG984_007675 [Apiospora sp. TS-2023a]
MQLEWYRCSVTAYSSGAHQPALAHNDGGAYSTRVNHITLSCHFASFSNRAKRSPSPAKLSYI